MSVGRVNPRQDKALVPGMYTTANWQPVTPACAAGSMCSMRKCVQEARSPEHSTETWPSVWWPGTTLGIASPCAPGARGAPSAPKHFSMAR